MNNNYYYYCDRRKIPICILNISHPDVRRKRIKFYSQLK